ncbi:MAG: putative lyase [bacterium ADurb.Bin157]|jgi:HEAT repeat protein|nr:MAG: putative lyase [bacterium ADurb.Bin157]
MPKNTDSNVHKEIEDLVTDLRSTLVTKRLKAVKELGKLKTDLAVEPLVYTLNDRSKEVRCAAVEAIGLINPANLADLIVYLAKDKSADVRLRVAHALGSNTTDLSVDTLMILVRDQKDEVANMAAKSLSKNPTGSLALLIRLFADNSWKLRSRAAAAVTRMGKVATEALKVALEDSDSNIRFWAITCLGHLRDRSNSKLLVTGLNDKDPGVRIAALRALRELGDPNIASMLFEALSQPSDRVRDLVYEILKDFGTHSIPYLMDSLSNEFWMGRSLAAQALTDMGADAVAPLVSALESQDKERRYWAIKILGKMREKTAYAAIKKFLSDPDPEIRMAALESMGYYLDTESIPNLIERFMDPAWVVRKHAARAVTAFAHKAVPFLIKSLKSEEEDVRYWALRSLGDLKPIGIFPVLVKLFTDRSWTIRKTTSDVLSEYGEDALMELTALAADSIESETKYWVLRSLGKIKSKISLPLLFRALDDESESIMDAAQKALSNYGEEIIDDLFALFKSEKRRLLESVCNTFQRMDAKIVVPKLCRNLGKFDEQISYWIRRTLCGFKKDSREEILKLLQSKSEEIRRQAVICLGQFGFEEDAKHVLPLLKDESWPTRIAAAEALGELGDPISVSHLTESLEDEDEDLAMASMISLGKIGDERAVPGLISTLHHESWALKFQAIRILGEMRVNRAFIDLLRLLDEDTLDLKTHIIGALSRISHAKCYDELKKRFEKEKDSEVKMAYIEAFAEIGNKDILSLIVKLAREGNENREERRAAIRALGKMHAIEGKNVLLAALREKDAVINREALSALELILDRDEFNRTEKAITEARKKQEAFTVAFNTGMSNMRTNNYTEAEKHLKEAVKINPRASYVYSALGNLYYKTGRLIDSTKAYVMATGLSPQDVTLKLNLGMVYYRRRAYKEAVGMFESVLSVAGPKSQQGDYSAKMINKIKSEIKK